MAYNELLLDQLEDDLFDYEDTSQCSTYEVSSRIILLVTDCHRV